ncbi:MAG: CBS domain-containing protein [Desulfopila sp.]
MDITLPGTTGKNSAIFSKLTVRDTMRRRAISRGASDTIVMATAVLIKHKLNSLLIHDDNGMPAGVVTKTEIAGAYYAGLPPATLLGDIMGAPVIQCAEDHSLEAALVTMQHHAIHRLYVVNSAGVAVGTLAYPDIVGTLYRYCCNCPFGLRRRTAQHDTGKVRYTVKDVMTSAVVSILNNSSIQESIEQLAAHGLGAVLVESKDGRAQGVISKTDIILAYRRGLDLENSVATIFHSPVAACHETTPLEEAIRQMIFAEVGRLFCYADSADRITGVLSLSDAARIRSGSCQACSSSRIEIKK